MVPESQSEEREFPRLKLTFGNYTAIALNLCVESSSFVHMSVCVCVFVCGCACGSEGYKNCLKFRIFSLIVGVGEVPIFVPLYTIPHRDWLFGLVIHGSKAVESQFQ